MRVSIASASRKNPVGRGLPNPVLLLFVISEELFFGTRLGPMPAFYKIDKAHKLVISTGSGVFNLVDGLAHQDQLLKDPDFDPSYSQLLNFTNVSTVDLSAEDVRKLAERRVFWPCARRAILVADELGFGFARMFEMLRESAGDEGIRVFRSLDDAIEWILPEGKKL